MYIYLLFFLLYNTFLPFVTVPSSSPLLLNPTSGQQSEAISRCLDIVYSLFCCTLYPCLTFSHHLLRHFLSFLLKILTVPSFIRYYHFSLRYFYPLFLALAEISGKVPPGLFPNILPHLYRCLLFLLGSRICLLHLLGLVPYTLSSVSWTCYPSPQSFSLSSRQYPTLHPRTHFYLLQLKMLPHISFRFQ